MPRQPVKGRVVRHLVKRCQLSAVQSKLSPSQSAVTPCAAQWSGIGLTMTVQSEVKHGFGSALTLST